MYVCRDCKTVYRNLKFNGKCGCPNANCVGGPIIEIDDALVPVILKFWEKDVETLYCCSGHPANFDVCDGYMNIVFALENPVTLYNAVISSFSRRNSDDFNEIVLTTNFRQDYKSNDKYHCNINIYYETYKQWLTGLEIFQNMASLPEASFHRKSTDPMAEWYGIMYPDRISNMANIHVGTDFYMKPDESFDYSSFCQLFENGIHSTARELDIYKSHYHDPESIIPAHRIPELDEFRKLAKDVNMRDAYGMIGSNEKKMI